jgi:hypothetical protein
LSRTGPEFIVTRAGVSRGPFKSRPLHRRLAEDRHPRNAAHRGWFGPQFSVRYSL